MFNKHPNKVSVNNQFKSDYMHTSLDSVVGLWNNLMVFHEVQNHAFKRMIVKRNLLADQS